MDDDNLLSGDGSTADFLNSTGADSVYRDNQSVADALDNGAVTSTGNSTTVSPPSWQNSLGSLFTVAGSAINTVKPLLGSTTGGTPTNATPAKAAAAKAGATTSTKIGGSTMLYIGLAVAAVLALLFFRK